MLRRKLMAGLALLTVAFWTTGCGSSTTTTPTTDTAGVTIFVGDSPACNILSYRVAVTDMTLLPEGGGKYGHIFTNTGGAFVYVNFAELQDMTTILHSGTIPVGTFNQAVISFGPAQFTVFDPMRNPPSNLVIPIFSDTTKTFNIQPPLTATKGGIYGLRVDLDVRHSVGVDAQGNLTGDVPPALTVSTVTPTLADGFGRLQDMRGFVLSVTNGSKLTQFIGTLNVQILSGSGGVPVAAVNVSQDTQINGEPATSSTVAGILGGSFVEVDGYVNAQGFLVARSIEVEDQEDVSQNRLGAIGRITSITTDAAGNATQFTLFVSDEQPEAAAVLGTASFATVNVSATTKFQNASRATNFAMLPFDGTSLQIGQEVVVHGPVTKGVGNVSEISADSIYLIPQTHHGSFASAVQIGSDDTTGAFYMKPCGAIFQGLPILVLTNSDTAFVNVTGLSGLTPQPELAVKGLLFYQLQGGTFNGVAVPPGTLVMVADQVHQLP
jgi:hypothetical protein